MFDYKKKLKLFGLTVFATVSLRDAQQVLTETIDRQNISSGVVLVDGIKHYKAENNIDSSYDALNSTPLEKLPKETKLLNDLLVLENQQSLSVSNKIENKFILISQEPEESNNSARSSNNQKNRAFILYFVLLVFAPLGIFYPFFLFYKKLLNPARNKNEASDDSAVLSNSSELKPLASFSPNSLQLEKSTDKTKAVVSKLQIAFAVEDDNLRQQLMELCSTVDSRTDRGIAELMRKTISLLIDREELTHACNSSESLTIDRIKTEFEAICVREKNKFTNQKLDVIAEDSDNIRPTDSPNNDLTGYMVVTLVLCTSHSIPLLGEIHTKNQLLEALYKLGKMRQDDLIKFDLLWNPKSEEQYLTNNELLKNYIDMVRLF